MGPSFRIIRSLSKWKVGGIGLAALLVAAPVEAAPWDVSAEVYVAEDGVVCKVAAGVMLMEKLGGLELRERDRVSEDEVPGLGRKVAEVWPDLVALEVNGKRVAGEVRRFGIGGERLEDGSYDRKRAVVRLEIVYAGVPPMQGLHLDWGLLPERFFETGAIDDLIAHLPPRDRSAIVGLHLGEEKREELEMRTGQEDFTWERAGESLPAKVEGVMEEVRAEGAEGEVDKPGSSGRTVLLVVLGVLLVVRVAMKSAGGRGRRR